MKQDACAPPLSSEWGMNVRLGVERVKTQFYAGVGLTYALSSAVKLELALDSTQGECAGEKGALRVVSRGASFAF